MQERPSNRLAEATSPYLLQHAHNPVAWQPWDARALEQARREDKPIFLSIGYSACHWCHVMERESFEDPGVARFLNEQFVPIKVDREERPDLDEIYMAAVQAITGRGGWPMSVWLTPELKPFFGGTYFPPTARHGLPGFLQLLQGVARAWGERRADIEGDAERLTTALAPAAAAEAVALPSARVFEAALEQLRRSFDARWGGFGGAPKFPQTMALELLLRRGTKADRTIVMRSLEGMWAGGMFDHLGGGFARYSVDARWLVPHFEKMLYDNALLASVHLDAYQVTGEPRLAQVARETLDYLLRDLADPAGGLHSSEDADSDGAEGRFYVFTAAEVAAALGPERAPAFCAAFGITAEGNFEHGTSVLHRFDAGPETSLADEAELRTRLLAYRATRNRPAKDDKVLAAWNGLALTALARGWQVLGEPRYLDAATALAGFLRRELWRDGILLRTWRRGHGHTPGFLEDYGAVAQGLIDLYEAGFDPGWLDWARQLGEAMLARFEDPAGGFFATAEGTPELLFRQRSLADGAIPAGNTLAAGALLRLARHLDRADFQASAERALAQAGALLEQAPGALLGLLSVLDRALAPAQELVLAGAAGDPGTQALLAVARQGWRPNLTLSLAAADPELPLHRGRFIANGPATAYLCRAQVCLPPILDAATLAAALNA
jgi:uncharacterized protein YyaL (SSP411 family)